MHQPVDQSLWSGRTDDEESVYSPRWHQWIKVIQDEEDHKSIARKIVLIGYCSDEGVTRNKGRPGAKEGPDAIRKALANLAIADDMPDCVDAGNIVNEDNLENSQQELSLYLKKIIQCNALPVVLGGGHEVGFASFKGAFDALRETGEGFQLGVINFDAHLDCRIYNGVATSGTPFTQSALLSESFQIPFHYAVIGYNLTANTAGVADFARQRNTLIIHDTDATLHDIDHVKAALVRYLTPLTHVYITVCLDVFHQAYAPGVSAPQAVGITPTFAIKLLRWLKSHCKEEGKIIVLFDIAEMNPHYDIDMMTAKLAARLIHEYAMPNDSAE